MSGRSPGGDGGDLKDRFRQRFVQVAGERIGRARAAIARRDPAVVASELHTVAGEAAMIGFMEAGHAARAGVDAARRWADGEGDEAACARELDRVADEVAKVAVAAGPPP